MTSSETSPDSSGFRADFADIDLPEPLVCIRNEARIFQEHAGERAQTESDWQRQTEGIRKGVPGISVEDDGDTIHLGDLSPGCLACKSGQWDCLFLAMRCNLKCAFCLTPQHLADLSMRSALGPDLSALCSRYARAGVRGVGFSGGEPLLQPELLLQWVGLLRRELPDLYLWAYTNGVLLTADLLGKLAEAGLDELRFNVAATAYVNPHVERMLGEAARRLPAAAVEVPAIPEHRPRLLDAIAAWADEGVKFLNLHELIYEAGSPSADMPGERRSCRMPDGHRCAVHPASSDLAQSVLARVAERRLPLAVHYCSLRNKARQLRGRRRLLAFWTLQPHERLREDGAAESICCFDAAGIQFVHPSMLPILVRRPGKFRMALVRRLLPLACAGEGQWVHFERLSGTTEGP